MCRLALMNNAGIRHIEKEYGLENLFNYLEKQLGGHGNGICCIYNDGSYYINKGVELTNKEIADDIMAEIKHIKWIIYHTRLASVGNISDRNCHPFENNGRVMAMNGTERIYTVINHSLTDTENILLSTKNITKETRDYHSVFLGYENGKVFANKNYGSLEYIPCKNGGRIFASTFPTEYYKHETVYEAPQNFVEGIKMNPLEAVRERTSCKKYYSWLANT
jgi:predicted glutamine amidotransferase